MTGGTFRTSVSAVAVATKAPQGNGADDSLPDAKVSGSGSGQQSISFGTGSGRFDILVSQPRSLVAGASETLDLFTGTDLKNVFGETAPFRLVKDLMLYVVDGGDSSGVKVGGASSNAWFGFLESATDKVKFYPGGPPLVLGSPAGATVTSTTKNLKIENAGAAAVTYRLIMAGSSAQVGVPMGLLLALTYP